MPPNPSPKAPGNTLSTFGQQSEPTHDSGVNITQAKPSSQAISSPHQHHSETTEYRHSPLSHQDEIRLLRLLPRQDDTQDIRCYLTNHRLSDDPEYEALSYAWGDPQPQSLIECDGLPFPIRPNLYAALEHLVDDAHERTIWIDAICINQADLAERAQQVALMGRLFANSTLVIVWGGLDKDHLAADAFEIIEQTVEFYDDRFEKYGSMNQVAEPPPPLPANMLFSLRALYDLPCLHRVWCMQEIGLAKNATLQWGRESISWASLIEVLMQCCYVSSFFVQTSSLTWVLRNMYVKFKHLWSKFPKSDAESWIYGRPYLRYELESTSSDSYNAGTSDETREGKEALQALVTSRSLAATVPHDYIYGFLGHRAIQPWFLHGEQQLEPDYTRHFSVLYTQVASRILNSTRALTLLSAVAHTTSTLSDTRCPSWCPRWDSKPFPTPLGLPIYGSKGVKHFYATSGRSEMWAGRAKSRFPSLPFEINGNILKTQALMFDHIAGVFARVLCDQWNKPTAAPSPSEDKGFTNPVQALLKGLIAAGHMRESPYENVAHALCYTLCAGTYWLGPTIEADINLIGPQFDAFLRQKCSFSNEELQQFDLPKEREGQDSSSRYLEYTENSILDSRRFALTSRGYMGLVPLMAQPTDICCVLPTATVPFVLRPMGSNQYKLIGECYMHGIMRGEALDMYEAGELELRDIEII